jgi:hypothetical protein
VTEPRFLVWSNQHEAWWGPARRGYRLAIEEAGRFSRAEAEDIVARNTLGGRMIRKMFNTDTGREYDGLDEVMVLAPESIPETP